MKRTFSQIQPLCIGTLLVALCNIICTSCHHPQEVKQPNILIIQADDLGYDDISLHGNTIIETPALDQLGRESIQFNQFYLSSVCAPSRAALLTGRNFIRTGLSGVHAGRDYVNLDEIMIAEVFKDAGYQTGMWGKWHSGKTDGYFPWDRGFDEAYYACLYNYTNNTGLLNGKPTQTNGYTSDVITDMAISFIKKHNNKPLFAYISHLAPHNPWRAPDQYIKKYIDKGLSKPMSTLYGMIDHLDHNIGRLLKAIDDEGLSENTIVVFLSDNGPWIRSYRFGLSEEEWALRNVNQRRGMKGSNWENGIHSSLFIRWPEQLKPSVINQPVKVEDLFPTLCHLANVEIPQNSTLDGQTILHTDGAITIDDQQPIFIADHSPVGDASYQSERDPYGHAVPFTDDYKETFTFEQQKLAIRKGHLKLIQDHGRIQLFDLQKNPLENDAAALNDSQLVNNLHAELRRWYNDLKHDDVYTMPKFIIGHKGRPTAHIYACAPSAISANLINKEHYLANWGTTGDMASYNIQVDTPGTYEVKLIHQMAGNGSMKFQVSTHNSSTEAWLQDSGSRNFGTLIEGESAYWENFDLPETFKKEIIQSSLGTIDLQASDSTLSIELIDTKSTSKSVWENQTIAFTLTKK